MNRVPSPPGSVGRLALAFGLVAALGSARGADAQGGASGPEFQVNTYTTDAQQGPAVGVDAQGEFVVVWQSWGSGETDTYHWSIQARRFAAGGAPLAAQFQVNYWTYSNHYIEQEGPPAVAVGAQGEFVVGWGDTECFSPLPYGCYYGMVAVRRFDAAGLPLGIETDVNDLDLGSPPELARAASTGNFVVVWSGTRSSGTDDSEASVQAKRLDADGQELGSQFQVNTYTQSPQEDPAVAADAGGNFVVVWSSRQSSGPDDFRSIQAQRFDADGVAQGAEFQVNTYTTGDQQAPGVAMAPAGNFVVVWESSGSAESDTSGRSIQARRVAADGTPLGDDFEVNAYTTGDQVQPRIAIDALGNFLVVWRSDGSGATDTDSTSIQARWFDADGNAQGDQFQVNTYTTSAQNTPSVAVRDRDNFVVAWQGDGSGGTDTSAGSIHARAYGLPFLDGFESGDTSHWTSTAP
jgi:hypothetical protein